MPNPRGSLSCVRLGTVFVMAVVYGSSLDLGLVAAVIVVVTFRVFHVRTNAFRFSRIWGLSGPTFVLSVWVWQGKVGTLKSDEHAVGKAEAAVT